MALRIAIASGIIAGLVVIVGFVWYVWIEPHIHY